MNRSDYSKAIGIVYKHYVEVLGQLSERLVKSDEDEQRSFDRTVDQVLDKYAHKFWAINTCLEQLRNAAGELPPKRVARIDCTHQNVEEALGKWLQVNASSVVIDIAFLDQLSSLTCVIVYQPCS
ncbi:MAG: hypothetical protein HQ518_22270 [Rhodopirellula sp.]|nr:hypothetical protein [Rhodopirellula sp.]